MARTQVVTILFCDLVSSTERRARLGDDAYDEFSAGLFTVLRAAVEAHGGREVMNAGDGLMIVFTESSADALSCAIQMHSKARELDTDDRPRLRVGISCGEVAQDGENYSGMPIVEAARLESAAAPGQTLANAVVRTLVGNRRAIRFREVGRLPLKGIPVPLETVEVVDDTVVDPNGLPNPAPRGPSPARRRNVRLVAAVVAVLALVVVVVVIVAATRGPHHEAAGVAPNGGAPKGVPAPVGYTPSFEPTACAAAVRKDSPDATCGYLVVPQNRAKPSGPSVRLLVVQAPARTPVAAGTAPSIDVCGCNDLATSVARDHAALIQIGGRGFTNSKPLLTCPEMVAVTRSALVRRSDDPEVARQEGRAMKRCHDRLEHARADLSQFNWVTGTQDELDLMTALHITRADFIASVETSNVIWGIVQKAPGSVRSMTIDNPSAPGSSQLTNPIASLSGAFDRFVEQCRRDVQCANGYPDLARSYRALFDKYSAHPELIATPNPDDAGAPPIPVLLDGPRVAQALNAALGDSSTFGLIPAAITEPTAAPLVTQALLRDDYYSWHDDAPWGALASFYCSYDLHTFDPGAIALSARTLPQFDAGFNRQWTSWCRSWPVPDVSNDVPSDIASPIPALLFRGDLSPFGSTDWIGALQSRLSNSQSAVFPTLSDHLITAGPPCLSVIRRTFLDNPMADLHTPACTSRSTKIEFQAPSS